MKKHKRIKILDQKELEQAWEFAVAVNGATFMVVLDKDYYQALTKGNKTPQKLIEVTFEFLLAREPVEEILPEFNLRQVKAYFADYEEQVA